MSGWPWASPEATRRALADLVARTYDAAERPVRLREVAYRRLLARLFSARPENWVVKGGVALILRLDPNRTSNDIDITYLNDAGESAVALQALRADAATDLGDFFRFEVDALAEPVDDSPAEGAVGASVTAYLGVREWARFSVDLAPPRVGISSEEMSEQTTLTGLRAVDHVPGLRALPIAHQVADKTCAIFERHGVDGRPSSRARDLADLAMIAGQVGGMRADDIIAALMGEEKRRLGTGSLVEPLPPSLDLSPEQAADWRSRWGNATRGCPLGFDDSLSLARSFLGPLLADQAGGLSWDRRKQRWG